MKKLMESKYGLLVFSLLSGVGYFILLMILLLEVSYSYLLGVFFFPAVIFGGALCVFKNLKGLYEREEYKKAQRFLIIHVALIAFSVIFGIILLIF